MARPSSSSSSPLKFPALSGFESVPLKLEESREKLNCAMNGLFVGPMPVAQFLEDFMPPLPGTPNVPDLPKNHFDAMPTVGVEKDMYQPFIDLIHDYDLIPEFKIINTSDFSDHDTEDGIKIKPDPTMYRKDLDTQSKRTQFGELELHFELKPNDGADPFRDPESDTDRQNHPFRTWTNTGSTSRSQIIHYATEWFSRQHRRFAFTVFIGYSHARFIRWDRAGAIVSERFNYREDSHPLIQFLWSFTHRDKPGRGLDPTVRSATAQEEGLARPHLTQWEPKVTRPFVVFMIQCDGGKLREFIAWGSMAHPGSLTGRCTRAYPVYEIASGKCYFLKDTWRAHDLEQEADILRELRAAGVKHIPPFVCGGDLVDDVTETDLYVPDEEEYDGLDDENQVTGDPDKPGDSAPAVEQGKSVAPRAKRNGSWRCGRSWTRITQRFHHRFIVDFIGKHLEHVENSKQMMRVVSDAFTAHTQAFELCGIIHRDISSRNILIDDNGRGILNDWDLAKRVSELKRRRRHERTGTWQFMSCLLLLDHHSRHTIQDDMESFVHIMLYYGLRYFRHNKTDLTLGLITDIFDYEKVNTKSGIRLGGENKKAMFRNNAHIGEDFHFSSPPLDEWMTGAFVAVKQWIEAEAPDTQHRRKGVLMAMLRAPCPVTATAAAPPEHLHLQDHTDMATIFSHCLSLEWPLDDTPRDVLPGLRKAMKDFKRGFGGEGWDEDGSRGGSRKKSKTSHSRSCGSGLGSGLGSTPHSMSTRSRTRNSNPGGSRRL